VPDEIASLDTQEERKVTELRIAQSKAEQLFHEVEARGLIRAGIAESQLNQKIYDLAKEMYGISTYWHKRIVRAGALAAGSGVCAFLVIFGHLHQMCVRAQITPQATASAIRNTLPVFLDQGQKDCTARENRISPVPLLSEQEIGRFSVVL
jgi:hypothetical protein